MKIREYRQKTINIISLIIVICIFMEYSTVLCCAFIAPVEEQVKIQSSVLTQTIKEVKDTPIQENIVKIEEIASTPAPIEVPSEPTPIKTEPITEKDEVIEAPSGDTSISHSYTKYLTKKGGIYNNPYTGLKETWYSQRVLPGRGLKIPGRHVNGEGFVCDGDGYICVASSTYPKGTIIETSRGMGKIYDSGCKEGILDIYTNW